MKTTINIFGLECETALTPAEMATLERLVDEAFERNWSDCRLREAGVIPGDDSPAELLATISQRH